MKDEDNTTEPTRSQLIANATSELLTAQRRLEDFLTSPTDVPSTIHVGTHPHNELQEGITELVREQWAELAKKAITRAKSRVAKAEKAVSALLASN